MSSRIEDELRATFEAASDFVQPRAGLAGRVRARSRRRRLKLTAALATATACVLIAAGGAYVAVHGNSATPPVSQQGGRLLITAPRGAAIAALLVGGRYLYTEMGPANGPISLAVYDRTNGRLIRRVTFPKSDLAELQGIGPSGSVWVVVGPAGNFGPVKVWLFSPDLKVSSVSMTVQSSILVPVSRTTALVPVARGLLRLTMPAPGEPGHASRRLEPGTSLGRGASTMPDGWAKELDGRVVVDLAENDGYDYHVVIAGRPGLRYGDQGSAQAAAVAGDSLWFANGLTRPLVRLNSQLKPTTPGFVTADPVLKNVSDIWSAGGAIWVSAVHVSVVGGRQTLTPDLLGPHALFCFPAQSQDGPVVSMPVRGYPWAVAAAGRTVYVLTSRQGNSLPDEVASYQEPAACR
jgi:hypothetical protein